MKTCSRCGTEHPLEYFYRTTQSKDGRVAYCKDCGREYRRSWERRNRVRARELHRAAYWRNRDAEAEKRRIARRGRPSAPVDPQRKAAKDAVYRAVKAGVLVRPSACPKCNREVKCEAHHPDYTRKLDVVWLCKWCHEQEHHASSGPAAPATVNARPMRAVGLTAAEYKREQRARNTPPA